jgi:hypothetical protein
MSPKYRLMGRKPINTTNPTINNDWAKVEDFSLFSDCSEK